MVMKTILRISLLLNFVALVGLAFLLAARNSSGLTRTPSSPTAAARATNTTPPISITRVENVAEPRPALVTASFKWSQMYSSDYHIYVKNLRATGCPEPTVRAIVIADVDSVYQLFANQMEKKLLALKGDSWSQQIGAFSSESAWRAALQKIPDEESAKIADLLGLKPAPEQVAASARTVAIPSSPTGPLPLALQDIDLSTLNLNADQKQLIADLRQQFLQQVGDPVRDQSDPAYLARLKKAQPEMDGVLKAMIGTSAFENYQLEVVNSHAGVAAQ
jgi:hypothetical protein